MPFARGAANAKPLGGKVEAPNDRPEPWVAPDRVEEWVCANEDQTDIALDNRLLQVRDSAISVAALRINLGELRYCRVAPRSRKLLDEAVASR